MMLKIAIAESAMIKMSMIEIAIYMMVWVTLDYTRQTGYNNYHRHLLWCCLGGLRGDFGENSEGRVSLRPKPRFIFLDAIKSVLGYLTILVSLVPNGTFRNFRSFCIFFRGGGTEEVRASLTT